MSGRAVASVAVYFRQVLNHDTACASYLFGCKSRGRFAVVDPHADLVDEYLELAARAGVPIVAVFETHVHADHVSGLPELVERSGATPYLPLGAGVDFEHNTLADGDVVVLGNTHVWALATPGHAGAHHAYVLTDHSRSEEPWVVLTGDSLLVGDVGRPDLHAVSVRAAGELARVLYQSVTERLLALPDHVLVGPGHFAGSVCGRGLSSTPISTIGFERRFNRALHVEDEDEFAQALLQDLPPAPEHQAEIVAANRAGRSLGALR
jgi:hydroxyacylglutathione hydrolase